MHGIVSLAIVVMANACAAEAPRAERSTIEISSTEEHGPGSIRAAIEAANSAVEPLRIVSRLRAGARVVITEALPYLRGPGTVFAADGLVLESGGCKRPDGREGCDGLVVAGPHIRVQRLAATGFVFDGIAVRGPRASDVTISDCHAFGNLDDGVGVSAGASGVVVERCVLENNGYRTKGKGILVFDHARAELRDNLVRYNRDGITVSKRSEVIALRNRIIDSYDKGLGIAGAKLTGSGNEIRGSGHGREGLDPPPNADGLRVTIDSIVRLDDTTISASGDSGAVVIGSARLTLNGSRITDNGGTGLRASDTAIVELYDTELSGNGRGKISRDDAAIVRRYAERAPR